MKYTEQNIRHIISGTMFDIRMTWSLRNHHLEFVSLVPSAQVYIFVNRKLGLTVLEIMCCSSRHSTCVSHRLRNLAASILSTTVLVCWKQHTLRDPSEASLYRGPGGGAGVPALLAESSPALSAQHSGLEP